MLRLITQKNHFRYRRHQEKISNKAPNHLRNGSKLVTTDHQKTVMNATFASSRYSLILLKSGFSDNTKPKPDESLILRTIGIYVPTF